MILGRSSASCLAASKSWLRLAGRWFALPALLRAQSLREVGFGLEIQRSFRRSRSHYLPILAGREGERSGIDIGEGQEAEELAVEGREVGGEGRAIAP